jgi:Ca2+-binding RTX toxin-like protein
MSLERMAGAAVATLLVILSTVPAWASNCYGGTPDWTGTAAGENHTGGNQPNYLDGAGGDDNLSLLGDNDMACGGGGADYIEMGYGDYDGSRGEDGNDHIVGEQGNDELYGKDGNDHIEGGGAIDHVSGGSEMDEVGGGDDSDQYMAAYPAGGVWGDGGNDTLTGGDGTDSLDGGDGWDSCVGEIEYNCETNP